MELYANDEELTTDLTTLLIQGKDLPNRDNGAKWENTTSRKWIKIPPFNRRRASKKTRIIGLVILFGACAVVAIILGVVLPKVLKKSSTDLPFVSDSELGNYSTAAVATDAAQCAQVGKDILQKNGSAVDSAIATLLCMGVVLPQSMGIGGGFLMTIYDRESNTADVLDAREVAPGGASENMYDNNPEDSAYGGLSVAVPGEIDGLYKAYSKYGKLPWADLFASSINLSRNGFEIGGHAVQAAETIFERITNNTGMRDLLINKKTGTWYKPGEIMKNEKLAETLEKIAKSKSSDVFYKGEIAKLLVQDIKDAGGIITEQDMASYQARWLTPIKVALDNYTIYSFPPPGSGALVAFILNILDGYNYVPLKNEEEEVLFFHRAIEAFKFAYAQRMHFEDSDSPEIMQLVKNLTNKEYANKVREKISDTATYNASFYGDEGLARVDHGTAHLSVVDANGNAVTVTSTINLYYGSLVRSMSTGILLNDEMDDFSANETNKFGVPPTKANRVHPGKRPMSSMAPTIFVDGENNVRLAIGGAGGTQITSGIALVTARNLWLGNTIKQAIDEPRIHDQLYPQQTTYEKKFPEKYVEALAKIGHNMKELVGRGSVIVGIARGPDGRLYANSDYRKGGKVDGV